ncbi:MAG: type III-B CRISPR module RAMP protein Cmr4 [Planctomycetota bacterium]|nr:MAG: type III-B CRISPR module RAMP protein Cmr4 [Planctomycetota bacterium]
MTTGTATRTTEARLLFLHAQTPVHPGSGTAIDVVDLPVQRERHTHWPLIPGTSLKGILRDACRPARGEDGNGKKWLAVFGPEQSNAEKHAGALTITDARLLAFPVRSLRGVFAWATCPSVLHRLARDLRMVGAADGRLEDALKSLDPNAVLCAKDSPLLVDGNDIVLEEYDFSRNGDCESIREWLAQNAVPRDGFTDVELARRLVVLPDDTFTHFAQHATEVVARIGLDYERKTVKQGALFYQEFLPTETILYSVVLANRSRSKDCSLSAAEVLEFVEQGLPPVIQVGGDETTGKGLCAVRLAAVS